MLYQPPPVAKTAEITISSASITLTLANNALYTFSSSAITEINLSAASGMKYCGFEFASGSTAPTFSYPADGTNDWIFEGADCSDGVFVPEASTRYRVAIEQGFGTYIGTVQKVSVIE
ncbi:MAG: hypothetical protein IJF84_05975 [Thermoguttaceae bacterium]|nr:hypothetical protein [Thermoguttaceae bacterium]